MLCFEITWPTFHCVCLQSGMITCHLVTHTDSHRNFLFRPADSLVCSFLLDHLRVLQNDLYGCRLLSQVYFETLHYEVSVSSLSKLDYAGFPLGGCCQCLEKSVWFLLCEHHFQDFELTVLVSKKNVCLCVCGHKLGALSQACSCLTVSSHGKVKGCWLLTFSIGTCEDGH